MRSRAPLAVPSGSGAQSVQQNGHSRNIPGFEMAARSPPNHSSKTVTWFLLNRFVKTNKSVLLSPYFLRRDTDTKHVPCKFFRQGACQAGPACPFLHSTDAAVDFAPCKYFTKVRLRILIDIMYILLPVVFLAHPTFPSRATRDLAREKVSPG